VTTREQASADDADLLGVNTLSTRASTVTILTAFPTTDPRGAKAVAIAANSGQWLKIRARNGAKYYGIRSSANADEIYFVTRTSCSCFDGQRRECKHQIAVQMHCQLVSERQPSYGVIPAALIVRED